MASQGNEPVMHQRAAQRFTQLVHLIKPDQWENPTPCPEWTVHDLVGHLVSEARWTKPLLAGKTIADVGDSLDGDLLGDDPMGAWDAAADDATVAVQQSGAMEVTTHLSFGDCPAPEYVRQLIADHLIHGWDLAQGIGAGDRLDPEITEFVAEWWKGAEDDYRKAGAVGPRPDDAGATTPQDRLLIAFGRSPTWTAP